MKILKIELILIIIILFLDLFSYLILNISIFQFFCNNININIFTNTYNFIYNIELLINNNDYYLNMLINNFINILFKNKILINELNNNLFYVSKNNDFLINVIFFDNFIDNNNVLFYPLQKKIYIQANEPTLVFYRIINNSDSRYLSYSFYYILPIEIILNFIKLQCFCMEDFIINSYESLDLPILFYIKPTFNINSIRLTYLLFLNLLI
jgi:cytochrome c oxidase assembly protein Cox11